MRACCARRESSGSERTLGIFELIVIAIVALIVIGPDRLPEAVRGAGKALRELRAASNTMMRELTDALDEPPRVSTGARATQELSGAEPPEPPAQT